MKKAPKNRDFQSNQLIRPEKSQLFHELEQIQPDIRLDLMKSI